MPLSLISLIYVSSSTGLYTDEDLIGILKKSCENNARLGITGMLLYKDGNLMQVLEGPEKAVHDLYGVIAADRRHRGVIMLAERPISEPEFSTWSMGFRNLKAVDVHDLPGYSEFMNEPLTSASFQANPTRAQQLLRVFRRSM